MLIKYLKLVREKSLAYSRKDINGQEVKRSKIITREISFFILSFLLLIISINGFSDKLLEYGVSALSILIGLFITILVFVSDKIPIKSANDKHSPAKEQATEKQIYNFYKQFSFMIGRTTILAIYCLILIFFLIQYDVSYNPFDYAFVSDVDAISVWLFCSITINLILRFFVIYWLARIFYNTLFAVASLTNVINLKNNKDDNQ